MQAAGSATDKSGPLTFTNNYVYNKADILGKGATATVYLGRHRTHGHVVAIKEFDQRQVRQILTAKKREIALLSSLDHKNIMKLLACEVESVSSQEVMVMEYCQGGSVHTLLENTQNMYGFREKEFLRFIGDVCGGLKYLRSLNIIHRDIKPGNIMKKIDQDGSSVFVLTDFGAARELPEDETFMSIYGTEEYIHPHMYQRAVLRQPGHDRFDSTVDLWSLGATIYHCACGHVPFKAFGGRQDAQTTFQITSGRASGVISGVQKKSNGPIEWSKTLPETCYLSRSLCRLIEPVLAGIFEPDRTRLITHDALFRKVEEIVSMATIKVFSVQTGTQVKIFIPRHERYANLQESIAKFTDIPSSRQVLLVNDKLLSSVIDINLQIQEYPRTLLRSQLFLFDRNEVDYVRYKHPTLPEFPALSFGSSLTSDVNIAKRCMGVAYFMEAVVKDTLDCQLLILEGMSNLRRFIQFQLQPAETCVPIVEKLLDQSSARFQSLKLSQTNLQSIASLFAALDLSDSITRKSSPEWALLNDISIEEFITRAKMRVSEVQVYLSVLLEKMKEQELVYGVALTGCEEEHQCLPKFQQLTQNISSVYTTFIKHKKYGELHPHEIFIHKVESRKLEDLCVKIVSLYQDHCNRNLFNMHRAAADYTGKLQKHLIRSEKVERNVTCVIDCHTQINEKLDRVDDRLRHLTSMITEKIGEIMNSKTKKPCKPENSTTTTVETSRNQSASGTDENGGELRKDLIRQIISEVDNLQNESSELDSCLQENINSMMELRSLLQGSNLNTSSL